MVKLTKKFLLLCIAILASISLCAQAIVVDEAGVLSADEIAAFEAKLARFEQKTKSQAVVVIVPSLNGKSREAFADDYFDYNGYGYGEEKEGVLLLIATGDGTPGSGDMHISTHGSKTIGKLSDRKIERLLDTLYDDGLKDRNYASAIGSYIDDLSFCFFNTISTRDAAVGVGGGLLTFLLSFFGIKRRNKVKEMEPAFNAGKNAAVSFVATDDKLISSNVFTQKIVRSESSSDDESSTHTSSSGETHGGGGRSF